MYEEVTVWRKGAWLILLVPQWGFSEELSLSFGVERFVWEEFDSTGSRLLDESGNRHRIGIGGEQVLSADWMSDAELSYTSGTVRYSGQDSLGNLVSTDTRYQGYGVELGVSYYPSTATHDLSFKSGLRVALGGDWWERSLRGSGGYDEDYEVTYARLAALLKGKSGWSAELGIKRPLKTAEAIDLSEYGFVGEVNLEPKGTTSLYGNLSYRLDERWGVRFTYDGYVFEQSDPVRRYNVLTANNHLIWQPKSDMQTLTVEITYSL